MRELEVATNVEEAPEKEWGSRLRRYRYAMRREDGYVGKRVIVMDVPGRRKGRPKWRWMDIIKDDRKNGKGMLREKAKERAFLRLPSRHIDPHKSLK